MKRIIAALFSLSCVGILQASDEREGKMRKKLMRASTAAPKRMASVQRLAVELVEEAALSGEEVSPLVKSISVINLGHKSGWEHFARLREEVCSPTRSSECLFDEGRA